MEKQNTESRRAVPVKMIWMLVSIGILLSCLISLIGMMGSRFNARMLNNIFLVSVSVLMAALGAGFCWARGCINLSLPGTMSISALVFALASNDGMGFFPAMLLAVLTGAVFGSLTGIFAIQRSRKIQLVTALSSLLVGIMATGIASEISLSEGTGILKAEVARGTETTIAIIWIMLAIGLCFAGAAGGARLFHTFESDTSEVTGGNRFLWSLVAGVLAALAGVYQTARLRTYAIGSYSDTYQMVTVFFVLITAGILIPNMRKSYSEALFGFLSVIFAALSHGTINMLCSYLGATSAILYSIYGIVGLLLLIPNILIYKSRKDPIQE